MSGGVIQQWSTHRDPYTALELPPRIQGRLGSRFVLTSGVVRTDGRVVFTESGSRYELGEPDPRFLEWLASNDYQFDPEHPIRLVKRLSNLKPPDAAPKARKPRRGKDA